MKEFESFEIFKNLKDLCKILASNPKNDKALNEIKKIIDNSPPSFVQIVQVQILSSVYPILKSVAENRSSFSNDEKQLVVDILKELFKKSKIDKKGVFFNIYSFLLFEIYDHKQHIVLPISEEYKLSIIQCMTSLANCLTFDLVLEIYVKENASRFCQMLYVALELAKNEQMKTLRICSIECILSIARIFSDDDFDDVVMRNQVADIFVYFIPGIISGFTKIALEDEKVGHKIHVVALKAWGRIVTLLMQNYENIKEEFNFENMKTVVNQIEPLNKKKKMQNKSDIKEYLNQNTRNDQWYKETDKKIKNFIVLLSKLVNHSHYKVRQELVTMCSIIIENCYLTMPVTLGHLIEMVIALSEDENTEVSSMGKTILNNLSVKFNSVQYKTLLGNLEEGFFNTINSLPRKFNGIDEKEQLSALNLLIGYINIFGENKLNHILMSSSNLNKLLLTLIHISELEINNISLLEEYSTQDLELTPDLRSPWRKFRYFKDESIERKLIDLCAILSKYGGFRIVSDCLLDIFLTDEEHRKEATFILNSTLSGELNLENIEIVKNIVTTYIEPNIWNLPLVVTTDVDGYEYTLGEIQNNIIQVCLLVEGIGTVALLLKEKFQQLMLRTLYLVFERAGSGHPLIKTAGLSSLTNISVSCGYPNITTLVIQNIDYFTYYVERKLNKLEENENVLNVLTVVLKYSKLDVLPYISNIIKEVLMQSCDKFKQKNSYGFLRIFQVFIHCLIKWLNIEIIIKPIKSKTDREKEMQSFYISGAKEDAKFSDEDIKKSAEEMYKEDMEKKKTEELVKQNEEETEDEDQGYKKPDPPMQIKVTVAVLCRCLHFLPTKERNNKLLVLDTLTHGLEIIKDWEDELLPIVHQIWSPLVDRFKEYDDPLIINYSFKLLTVLARLSKEFIRSRTQKDVLPNILTVLNKLSKESYLKDKGSAYRYSQSFKLQLTLTENFARLLIDLDVSEKYFNKSMDSIFQYLSDKQPKPLQENSIRFFEFLNVYDNTIIKNKLEIWKKENEDNEFKKNIDELCKLLNKTN